MSRPLTGRERDVLLAMIDHAEDDGEQQQPTPADRAAWRAAVPGLTVDGTCGCGTCPSISLVDESAPAPGEDSERVVLWAGVDDALILLFIDGGCPSYLELAPLGDDTRYAEFPEARRLSYEKG